MYHNLNRILINIIGITTATVGLLVLTGWQFDIEILKRPEPLAVSMKANAAFAFFLSGFVLIFLQKQKALYQILIRIAGLFIAFIGLLTLSEYIVGWDLGIDEIIFRDSANAFGTLSPGRMAPNTAVNFALIGISYIVFTVQAIRKKFFINFAITISLAISIFSLLGYSTSLLGFDGIGSDNLTKMAFYSSFTFIILCIGILSTRNASQLKSFTIKQKLFSALSVVATIIIFVSLLSSSNIRAMYKTSLLVEHTQEIKEEINKILADVVDLETGTRGFIISGDINYLEPTILAKKRLPLSLIRLNSLTSNAVLKLSLDTLSQLTKKRIIISDQLSNLKKTKVLKSADKTDKIAKAKILTESIRILAAKMLDASDNILIIRNKTKADTFKKNQLILYTSLVIQLFLLFLISLFINKYISEKRKAELALRRSNSELETNVLERTKQLSEVNENLYIQIDEKSRLTTKLEDYQIELQSQNEDLLHSAVIAEEAADKYTELYDFAPTGYFSLTKDGEISELNMLGSAMLGKEKTELLQSKFVFFVSEETKPIFNLFIQNVYNSQVHEVCELILLTDDNKLKDVNLTGIADKKSNLCFVTAIDITERKQSEKKVFFSNARSLAILNAIPDLMFQLNHEGVFMDYKAQSSNDLFVPGEKIIGKKLIEILPAAIVDLIKLHIHILLEYGIIQVFEYPLTMPDGLKYFEARMTLSSAFEIVVIVRNITEKKAAESFILIQRDLGIKINSITKLKNLYEESLKALLEISGMDCGGFYLFDKKNDCLDLVYSIGISKQFSIIFSHFNEDSEQVKLIKRGKPVFITDILIPVNKSDIELSENLNSVAILPLQFNENIIGCISISAHQKVVIALNLQKGIETVTVLVSNAFERIRSEEKIRFMNAELEIKVKERTGQLSETNRILQDEIEERKRTEISLNIQSSALNAAANAIVISDNQGNIQWTNTAFTALTGYTSMEINGKNPRELKSGKQDTLFYKVLWDTILAGNVWHGELINLHKDGNEYNEEMTITPIKDETEKIVRFIAVKNDITKRKQEEEEIKNAKTEAEDANQMKSEFLANMSHEIRTPLNAVIGLGYLLEQTSLTDEQRSFLRKINFAGRSLLSVANNVLDLSKIEAREMRLEDAEVDLKHLVQDIGEMLTPSAHAKGLALTVHCAAALPSQLRGDTTRMSQIVTNLLSNAIKFTEKGQVELVLSCSTPTTAGITVRLSVRDTGIGIAPEGLARLFKPFSQADTSTTRRFGGTGLGLSIARRFAELMGGEIGVTSTVGVGSEFWVEIPLRVAVAAHSLIDRALLTTDGNLGPRWLSGAKILVVDDSEINCEVAQHILRGQGATVVISGTGAEALERLRQDPNGFEIVLMDVQMPDMDGNETTRRIRTELHLTLPIIALTAGALPSERERSLQAGMNDFMTKPFDPAEMARCIHRHLRITGEGMTAAELTTPALVDEWPEIEGIDGRAARARLRGDVRLFQSMLRRLFAEGLSVCELAEPGAVDALAIEPLAARLHKLRGAAATLGATDVTLFATAAEEHCRARDGARAAHATRQLLEALRVLQQAANLRDVDDAATMAGEPGSPLEIDAGSLADLIRLLRDSDLAAIDRFTALSPQLLQRMGKGPFNLAREHLDNLRFAEVATELIATPL